MFNSTIGSIWQQYMTEDYSRDNGRLFLVSFTSLLCINEYEIQFFVIRQEFSKKRS